MPQLIIGLVGRQGSGKGTAAKILQTKYGASLFRFSAILGDVLNRIAISPSRENLIAVSGALRETFGEDVLAYAIERDVMAAEVPLAIVDGIRRVDDIAALEPSPTFKLVEISAPAKVRFERMKGRGEKPGEREMSWDEFAANEEAPTEITIPAVAARAWKAIDNSGTAAELEAKIDEMMKELHFDMIHKAA